MKDTITLLAIETSCDETSVAIVKNGRDVVANIVSSQIDEHRKFGGVVPEIASRMHLEAMNNIVEEALEVGNMTFSDIDVVGVTKGPGLIGALLVGITCAKALSAVLDIPLVGVNHMQGHICANYIAHPDLEPPFIALVVSGGHTYLIEVEDYQNYTILGRTRDDAAGESYDKVARAMGLGYPGGPEVDRLALHGNPEAIAFPRIMLEKDSYDFSFSGLKTAVLNYLNNCYQKEEEIVVEDVCASFQQAVLDVLHDKTFRLLKETGHKKLVVSGGVAANGGLRRILAKTCEEKGIALYFPPLELCTDNAAMIGCAAYYDYMAGKRSDLTMRVYPNLEL